MGLSHLQVLLNTGKLDQALSHIDKIEDHYQPDHPEFFNFKLTQAKILLEVGKYEQGEKMLNSLIDIGRRSGSKLIRLDMVVLLADFLWRKGNWDQAFFMIEMGEYDFTKLGDEYPEEDKDRRYAELKRLKGIFYRYSGELDLAIEYFQECLFTAEKTNDSRLVATIYNLLGLVYHEVGELSKSWTFYAKAHELRDQMSDEIGTAVSQFNLAGLQEFIGDFESAETNFSQAYLTAEETGNQRLKANAMASLGILKLKKGQFKIGMQLVNNGLTLKSNLGNDIDLSWTFYKLMIFLLHSEHSGLTPIFMDGLSEVYQRNRQNSLIYQHYQLVNATIEMKQDHTISKANAQKTFKEIAEMTMIDLELTLYGMISYCHMLINELQSYPAKETVEELLHNLEKLEGLANEQYSLSLLADITILKARFAFLQMNYPKALDLINSVLELVEQKDMYYLEYDAARVYNQILRKIEEMNARENEEINKISMVEESEKEQIVANLIQDIREIESPISQSKLFIITDHQKEIIMKIPLSSENVPDDDLVHRMLSTLNMLLNKEQKEVQQVERIKHGEFHILSKRIQNITCHYVYKGEASIIELSKLEKIISELNRRDLLTNIATQPQIINKIEKLIKETVDSD